MYATRKDYWPELLRLADNQGKIVAPGRKNLEEYLGKALNLSKPTIISLLNEWKEKKLIKIEKEGFLGKSVALQIVGSAVILIDLENIFKNWPIKGDIILDNETIYQRFDNLVKEIAQKAGEVVARFVFTPPHLASSWAETFKKLGFLTIYCLKIWEEGIEKDTVDKTLIQVGMWLIGYIPMTHLCVVSGDSDFIELYEAAAEKGIKRITAAVSLDSLSHDLIAASNETILLFPTRR